MPFSHLSPGARPIFRLSYVSEATRPLEDADFAQIAEASKRNNTENGLTGLLAQCAGEFLQVIEGDQDLALRLFETIKADPRHANITVVSTETAAGRAFADWSMGCFMLAPEQLPEGFFFCPDKGRQVLRPDAFKRVDWVLASFYRDYREAGKSGAFANLPASAMAPA